MKKLFIALLLITCVRPLRSEFEDQIYYLGLINVAGMVPDPIPLPGSILRTEAVDQELFDPHGNSAGYIPIIFQEAIGEMMDERLQIIFEVEHVYENALPGRFMSITVWVRTQEPEKLKPLIYAVPVHQSDHLVSIDE